MDLQVEREQTAISYLRTGYAEQRALYQAQSASVQHFLEAQARGLADAILAGLHQAKLALPDQVRDSSHPTKVFPIQAGLREQNLGGLASRFTQLDLRSMLREWLAESEHSPDPGLQTGARLIQHALALHLVYSRLSSGRTVHYSVLPGEEIPSEPAGADEPASALTAATDAIVESGGEAGGQDQLQVPYVPYARRFFLPQWVAFDDQGRLLVQSFSQAEAVIASMQQYVFILHSAVYLAPYMIADEEYQRKRYGMLGQLVNQGRRLAQYQTEMIIQTIWRRAAANDLNRGLRLSLPYFDDQDLQMRWAEMEVIPAGRIMFLPAFVVRAAREQQAKAAQDTRLNLSTRKHLLTGLKSLETAFLRPSNLQ